ncbi:syntaxin-binding protein 4 isoform X2 [Hemicordylus capensis]|uniref:syntaxin-binding protein 4 isoform X2 n=1 Tax=Hemicordylus capensis TaxID=884348 RepID=UPI0023036601|nr:syntaxin-binding protein 4 isoform X2 [Hemicordylus capensis]XP_053144536.1 syntaxin-binding protein 4 isoform X2 [Hemicordylus capensis]XP_053144537.1 syntaxin-binding protein 4 isoform X2 [Hemicordylus capensis]XP_053144538.1 syntaxin-binding protein 4 isoform X2 [Hemicordylus capensis]XP_053144539.1 syntaxin-binding protein 4 isoform X2 [Hemicordylus capensis]
MKMASIDANLPKMTIMGPHGINRAIHRIAFSDCQNGLGIKVIGGYREESEEDYGIFIKRILPGGMAAVDSRLLIGDLILEVNGENLVGVTNERALDILRTASASNHVSLLIARDDEAKKDFLDLLEKYSSQSNASSARNSPTQLQAGKSADSLSSGSSSRPPSPQLLHQRDMNTNYHGQPAMTISLQSSTNDSTFQIITVSKGTGLGLNIVGGINRNEGPLVYVLEAIPGGDCHKDGRLRSGDQLVSINKESLIGITYEEARSLINRTKLRSNSSWEIAFIRHKTAPSQFENTQASSSLLTSGGCGLQHAPSTLCTTWSPNEIVASKMSGLNVMPQKPEDKQQAMYRRREFHSTETKVGFKKREQSSANNSTADVAAGAVGPTWSDDYEQQRRKISLNPTVRLKADKLEMALNYLGIQPTKEQQEILRQQLPKDSKGTVSFGDFVQMARKLFCLQLDGTGSDHGPAMFSNREIARLLDSQFVSCDPLEIDEMEGLRKERNEALKEICKLKEELAGSERMRKQLAEELQTTKQEAKASVEETRTLRSRIHLAEAAQKQAHGMEMDYEEVIRLLEVEIAELKAQLADHCGQNKDSIQDLRKRITVLDCQLRKSETAKKAFEVTTEKLLQFVEILPELLSDSSTSMTNLSDRKATFSSKTLLARLGRNGRTFPASLATEAKELAKSVRAILEADCLPYGWEEAFTADGIKYFINHVTQTTSWIHPVTNVLALSCSEENEDDAFKELADPKS